MRVYSLSNYSTFKYRYQHALLIGPLFTTNTLYHIPAGSRYPLSLLLFVSAVPSNYKKARNRVYEPTQRTNIITPDNSSVTLD